MGILDGIVEWIAEQVMAGLDLVTTSVLGALGCDMAVFLRYFPAAETMYSVFVALAVGIILLNWVWQLFKNFGLGAGIEAEDPVKLSIRSVIFILLALFSDEIVNIVLTIGGTPYRWIMDSELPPLSFADFNSVMLVIIGVCANGAVALITLILVIILAWNYLKLLLEAAERYVLLGVLVYTAPVAFSMGASQTTSRSGVIIGLGSRLQVFQSELIKKITTRDEIDLELPGQERCAYFLVTSDQDSTFDFLASLFLSFCFIKLVRYADKNCEGGKLPVPVHILGEELTACGTIPDLSRRLSVIRSRNISMSCVFQNLAGLQNRYPLNLWQEILGNCDAQLFLGCTDSLTAEFISERTGLASVSVSSKSKQLGTWRISNYTPEYRETSGVGKRPVLTPDEVLRLPITQALVIIRGQKALKVEKMDYSKHPESSKLRDCKASAHIPEWRKLEEQAQPKPAAAPSPAPKPQGTAPKKPAKRKPKAVGTPAGTKQAAPAPSTEAPDGIITTDKDSILS